MVTGYILYGMLIAIHFPFPSAYGHEMLQDYMSYMGIHSFKIEIIKRILDVFLYGMVTNIFVYVASVLFTDRYVLMSFPVMAAYIYNSIINHLESWFISSEKEQYLDILQIVKPDTIINGNSFFTKK